MVIKPPFEDEFAYEIKLQRQMVANMKFYCDQAWKADKQGDANMALYYENKWKTVAAIFDQYSMTLCVCWEMYTGNKITW